MINDDISIKKRRLTHINYIFDVGVHDQVLVAKIKERLPNICKYRDTGDKMPRQRQNEVSIVYFFGKDKDRIIEARDI